MAPVKAASFAKSAAGVPRYQLKITLRQSKPPIWRRVVVRGNLTLDRLHDVIQIAMGWTGGHMHQFIAGSGSVRAYYGPTDPEFGGMGAEMLDEQRHTVASLAPAAKRRFTYEYDFGDGWQHEVLVEKLLPPDPEFKHPVCLAGANACPPEDCGGIGGYYHLLEIMADPKHPEHKVMKEWVGGKLEPEAFNLDLVNSGLKQLRDFRA